MLSLLSNLEEGSEDDDEEDMVLALRLNFISEKKSETHVVSSMKKYNHSMVVDKENCNQASSPLSRVGSLEDCLETEKKRSVILLMELSHVRILAIHTHGLLLLNGVTLKKDDDEDFHGNPAIQSVVEAALKLFQEFPQTRMKEEKRRQLLCKPFEGLNDDHLVVVQGESSFSQALGDFKHASRNGGVYLSRNTLVQGKEKELRFGSSILSQKSSTKLEMKQQNEVEVSQNHEAMFFDVFIIVTCLMSATETPEEAKKNLDFLDVKKIGKTGLRETLNVSPDFGALIMTAGKDVGRSNVQAMKGRLQQLVDVFTPDGMKRLNHGVVRYGHHMNNGHQGKRPLDNIQRTWGGMSQDIWCREDLSKGTFVQQKVAFCKHNRRRYERREYGGSLVLCPPDNGVCAVYGVLLVPFQKADHMSDYVEAEGVLTWPDPFCPNLTHMGNDNISKSPRLLVINFSVFQAAKHGYVYCLSLFPNMETMGGPFQLLSNELYRTYGP